MQMCSHYLVDPVACTPTSGGEKGEVENQVGLVFTPRLRFKTLDELNACLLDKCITYTKAHRHPELAEQTVWEVLKPNGQSSFPAPAGSTDSMRCRHWSRRPAWCATTTTTNTRSRPAPSDARSRFMPMPTAS